MERVQIWENSSNPALILELKWDKTAEGAISQIKSKNDVSALAGYKGNILLIGINYEKKSKKHPCRILSTLQSLHQSNCAVSSQLRKIARNFP